MYKTELIIAAIFTGKLHVYPFHSCMTITILTNQCHSLHTKNGERLSTFSVILGVQNQLLRKVIHVLTLTIYNTILIQYGNIMRKYMVVTRHIRQYVNQMILWDCTIDHILRGSCY